MIFNKWCNYMSKSDRPRLPIILTAALVCGRYKLLSIFDLIPTDSYASTIIGLIIVAVACSLITCVYYGISWLIWMAIYDVIDYIRGDR